MLEFERRAPATVANPDTGSDVLFLDNDGVFYTKNSAGALTVLGRGIVSIAKTGTAGLVDTYTITFSGGTTQTYTVTNGDDGRSIVSIARTSGAGAPGTTDTYTITYSEAPLTSTFTVYNGANGTGMPANAAPPAIAAASSVGTTTGEYALEDHTHAGVTSFNGRQGAVTPQQSDYDAFFTTPAEASAAAPVQSVAGKQGAVTLTSADVGLANVKNPVVMDVRTVAPQTLNQTLTAAGTITIPANTLVAGDAFDIDVLFGTLVNATAASNLEVAVFLNGAQNAIAVAAMGTTAVPAPGRGGRALFKLVFRTVGAAGTALANGTIHVNNLANFASNQVAVQTVNTTASITLDVRVRTSVATTTGTVQIVAIEQCT